MEISDRIRLIRETAGLTRTQFAERLGISASEVTNVEFAKIKNMASKESLFRSIASEFDVSLDWIKTGEGDMYGATPRDDVAMAFGSLLAMHDPVVDGFIEFFRSRTPEQRRELVEQLRELVALIDKHSTKSEG